VNPFTPEELAERLAATAAREDARLAAGLPSSYDLAVAINRHFLSEIRARIAAARERGATDEQLACKIARARKLTRKLKLAIGRRICAYRRGETTAPRPVTAEQLATPLANYKGRANAAVRRRLAEAGRLERAAKREAKAAGTYVPKPRPASRVNYFAAPPRPVEVVVVRRPVVQPNEVKP